MKTEDGKECKGKGVKNGVSEEKGRGEKELRLNEGRRGNKDMKGENIKERRRQQDTWHGHEKGRTEKTR